MKRDLDAAAVVQAALLPGSPATPSGARFAWEFKPCTELAGDLLNIIPIDGRRVALYVLDVVGHGVAAAMVAVMVNRVLGQLHLPGSPPVGPVDVAARLNREFTSICRAMQFFTLLYGVLEVDTGAFRFVTAGHPGPAHVPRSGAATNLRLPGWPMGLSDEPYQEHSLTLGRGDRLYLYSDGIPEAHSKHWEAFGEGRLLKVIEQGRDTPLPDSLVLLLKAVQDWCGSVPPGDDISLLAVERE
jgi:sigma-B regulation protein RsbU (phosphoserine phosphatase)